MSTEMLPDKDGFVLFQRARVRLLFGHPYDGEHVENGLAFDL
jgi:hypothetical protein